MSKFLASILILGFFFCLGLGGYKLFVSLTHPIQYRSEINDISNLLDVDSSLIASIINTESSYRQNAKSGKNAIGLMQIKVATAEYINEYYHLNIEYIDEEYLYQPYNNIYMGTLYIKYLKNKFESTDTILACYNAGETRVRVWLKDEQYSSDGKILKSIPYKETNNYIRKVNSNLKFYSKVYK